MKKLFIKAISFALCLAFSCEIPAFAEEDIPDISARAAILIDSVTGRILYEKNADERLPMASTTKIMTTLICLESGGLDEEFAVDPTAIMVEGSSMGLCEGDIVSKRDLCIGMLLPSGNDAANATAVKLSGDIAAFSGLMNARAAEIGMENSHFVTPSGLHDDEHYSTAYDMSLLTREALRNNDFAEICAMQSAELTFGNPPYTRWLKNSNKLLWMYDGCIGVKTGFTDEAGRCLVSAAERDGVRLICVTLNAPNDWSDHEKLYDYGFSRMKLYGIAIPDDLSVPVVGGDADSIPLRLGGEVRIPFADGDFSSLEVKVYCPPFLYAPVSVGDEIGRADYYVDGDIVASAPLLAVDNIAAKAYSPSAAEKLRAFIQKIYEMIRGSR